VTPLASHTAKVAGSSGAISTMLPATWRSVVHVIVDRLVERDILSRPSGLM